MTNDSVSRSELEELWKASNTCLVGRVSDVSSTKEDTGSLFREFKWQTSSLHGWFERTRETYSRRGERSCPSILSRDSSTLEWALFELRASKTRGTLSCPPHPSRQMAALDPGGTWRTGYRDNYPKNRSALSLLVNIVDCALDVKMPPRDARETLCSSNSAIMRDSIPLVATRKWKFVCVIIELYDCNLLFFIIQTTVSLS